MSGDNALRAQNAPAFLQRLYPKGYENAASSRPRPYITLTYAQSLDGCIAGVGGKQILLSGKESMVMTHWWDIYTGF